MTEIIVKSFGELAARIKKDLRDRDSGVRTALRKVASEGAKIVKRNVPVAHGELRESVHADAMVIVVDAPHAAAVNNGSRPHWMPLAPLIAWVKLRGMQGLATERQIGRLPGTSTIGAASGIAAMLRAHESGGSSSVDAPEQVARAIQHAIAMRGTKPHHFVEKSMPAIRALLDAELRKALKMPMPGPDGPAAGSGSTSKAPASTSGAYRKHAGTFRGAQIQTDHQGRQFADLKNGTRVFINH